VSTHSTYDMLRHLADSWGLVAMMGIFVVLVAWPFLRPGGKQRSNEAATMIFRDDDDGQ
jgi:cytochrome c oxidase cbb3-type subunit IV